MEQSIINYNQSQSNPEPQMVSEVPQRKKSVARALIILFVLLLIGGGAYYCYSEYWPLAQLRKDGAFKLTRATLRVLPKDYRLTSQIINQYFTIFLFCKDAKIHSGCITFTQDYTGVYTDDNLAGALVLASKLHKVNPDYQENFKILKRFKYDNQPGFIYHDLIKDKGRIKNSYYILRYCQPMSTFKITVSNTDDFATDSLDNFLPTIHFTGNRAK